MNISKRIKGNIIEISIGEKINTGNYNNVDYQLATTLTFEKGENPKDVMKSFAKFYLESRNDSMEILKDDEVSK